MELLVIDPRDQQRLIAEHQAGGGDRFDEVWEGTYIRAPLLNDEHQDIQAKLVAILQLVVGWRELGLVRAGVNVSDRDDGWELNYRCPDVAVFMTRGRSHPHAKSASRDDHLTWHDQWAGTSVVHRARRPTTGFAVLPPPLPVSDDLASIGITSDRKR